MIALSHQAFTPSVRPTSKLTFHGLLTAIEGWTERHRQRRALLALSDHALKDIGLNSADAWQEGRKPFWRA